MCKEYELTTAIFYDYYAMGVEGDVDFYIGEMQKSDTAVLELGCGTGRIAIPAAEAGIEVTGLDRSHAMLSIAKIKLVKYSNEVNRRIELIEADMRSFSLGRKFSLIIIPYRSFLHLLTPEDQQLTLIRIRDHLVPGGRLIFNVFDPRLDMIVESFNTLGSAKKKDLEFTHPETGLKVIVWDTRKYDPVNQIIEQYFILEELDEDGRVLAKTYAPLKLRYVFRYEMQYLLELCGFEVVQLYGDFKRGAFKYGGEQIWIARKSKI